MEFTLNKLISTLQVHDNGRVWMIPRNIELGVLSDYLNAINNENALNEQNRLISKLKSVLQIESFDQRWEFFENELGGVNFDKKQNASEIYGWISLINFQPNILLDLKNNKLFLSYLESINSKIEVSLVNLEQLIKDWCHLTSLCGSLNYSKIDSFEYSKEIKVMVGAMSKYIR